MKQTVDLHDFREAFRTADRMDNFSWQALEVLFDYLEQYEEDYGSEIELDVVALCCEYNEEHWSDIASNYGIDLDEDMDDEEKIEAVGEYLNDNTSVCGFIEDSGCFVYAIF